MPRYRHMPNHPYANKNGMVEMNGEYYEGLYLMGIGKEDKRMFVGNEPVVINYISDGMDATRHMANGKIYDSKSKFRKITKQAGCIEVGNNPEGLQKKKFINPTSRKELRDTIKRSMDQWNNKELPERDIAVIKQHSEKVDWVNRNRTRKLHQSK